MADPFKAYDIRGIYPEEVNEELAYKVGRAIVFFLKAKNIAVGMDMRTSSPSLYKSLAKGITDQGGNVHFIGMCTTPLLSFTVVKNKMDGGVMISASHNPGQYNAFKLIRYPVLQIGKESGIEEIKDLVISNIFREVKQKGKIKRKNSLPEYVKHVQQHCRFKNLKIVIDHGNGVGAITAKEVLKKYKNSKFIHLYENPDGTFPNHEPNPHEQKNFFPLQNEVLRQQADLGILFDGDADRALFVDENGEIIQPDHILCLLAMEELKKYPRETVYYDLRFSKVLKEEILAHHGKPVMLKVGNPYYKEALVKKGGILGGEFSGHIMFKSNYCIDDGLFAAVKLMNILSREKNLYDQKMSELVQHLKRYHASPEINIKVKNKEQVQKTLTKIEKAYKSKNYKKTRLDGLTIEAKDYWFNIRPSNTEPLLRLRIEANTNTRLKEVTKKLEKLAK